MTNAQEDFQTFDVLNIPISVVTLQSAADALVRWSQDQQGRYVGVREVASVMAMSDNPELIAVACGASMNVPDGMPLVWIGKRRGLKVERACGPDLMKKVILESSENNLKHFLYGGKEGVANKLVSTFREIEPKINIVGTYCPPFRELTDDEEAHIIQKILDSQADVVWVGISSPKQDVWMAEHVNKLPVTMVGVGAAFDFHSGEVKRAPLWMQKSGLEWLHRLCNEPLRLWKRYLILAPKFVLCHLLENSR